MEPTPAGVPIAGGRVRELRQLLGDNLVAFAPKAQITFQYLSQIERGDRKFVSPEVFVRICDALGVDDRTQLLAKTAA